MNPVQSNSNTVHASPIRIDLESNSESRDLGTLFFLALQAEDNISSPLVRVPTLRASAREWSEIMSEK